jgi:imidazolonepropionase-like amidohydrolase
MEALVAAGLSPMDVIRAATVNAARALAIADSVGQVAAGMSADFVVVPGDPVRDVSVFRHVQLVVSRGRVVLEPASATRRER